MHMSSRNAAFELDSGRSSGTTPIGAVIGIFVFIISIFLAIVTGSGIYILIGIALALFLAASIKVAAEWERVIILRIGKYSRMVGPGLFSLYPFSNRRSERI